MRRFALAVVMIPALFLGVTGCSSSKQAGVQAQAKARYLLHTSGPVLYSPNGEPLSGGVLGRPGCFDAVAAWFARVDANRDGQIDRPEFMADARVQFLRMDLDGDNSIYPSELLTFRGSFQGPAPHNAAMPSPAEAFAADRDKLKALGLWPKDDADTDEKTKKLQDYSDPVMTADNNLDFRVTLDEFTALAQDNFKGLDLNHDNKLERYEVFAACPPSSFPK